MTHPNLEDRRVQEVLVKSNGKELWELTWEDIDEINKLSIEEFSALQITQTRDIYLRKEGYMKDVRPMEGWGSNASN